jgi:hypothetical protein
VVLVDLVAARYKVLKGLCQAMLRVVNRMKKVRSVKRSDEKQETEL